VPISLKRSYGPPIVAAAGALMLLGMFGLGRALGRDSLWKIVHDQCVPNETENDICWYPRPASPASRVLRCCSRKRRIILG